MPPRTAPAEHQLEEAKAVKKKKKDLITIAAIIVYSPLKLSML